MEGAGGPQEPNALPGAGPRRGGHGACKVVWEKISGKRDRDPPQEPPSSSDPAFHHRRVPGGGGLDPALGAPKEGGWWSPLPQLTPLRPAPAGAHQCSKCGRSQHPHSPAHPPCILQHPEGAKKGPSSSKQPNRHPPPELREAEYLGSDVKKGKNERRRGKKKNQNPLQDPLHKHDLARHRGRADPCSPHPATPAGPMPGSRTHSCGIPPPPAARSVVETRGVVN